MVGPVVVARPSFTRGSFRVRKKGSIIFDGLHGMIYPHARSHTTRDLYRFDVRR